MSYADSLGVPYVLFLGDDEIAAGKVSLKDMRTGEQELLAPDEAKERIAHGVAALADQKVIRA
jgi:histidyl-tRNA synthetase